LDGAKKVFSAPATLRLEPCGILGCVFLVTFSDVSTDCCGPWHVGKPTQHHI
jgi:hypothetical protein